MSKSNEKESILNVLNESGVFYDAFVTDFQNYIKQQAEQNLKTQQQKQTVIDLMGDILRWEGLMDSITESKQYWQMVHDFYEIEIEPDLQNKKGTKLLKRLVSDDEDARAELVDRILESIQIFDNWPNKYKICQFVEDNGLQELIGTRKTAYRFIQHNLDDS